MMTGPTISPSVAAACSNHPGLSRSAAGHEQIFFSTSRTIPNALPGTSKQMILLPSAVTHQSPAAEPTNETYTRRIFDALTVEQPPARPPALGPA